MKYQKPAKLSFYEDNIDDETQVFCKQEFDGGSLGMNTPSRINHWNKTKDKGETHSDIYFNFLSTAETPQRRQVR